MKKPFEDSPPIDLVSKPENETVSDNLGTPEVPTCAVRPLARGFSQSPKSSGNSPHSSKEMEMPFQGRISNFQGPGVPGKFYSGLHPRPNNQGNKHQVLIGNEISRTKKSIDLYSKVKIKLQRKIFSHIISFYNFRLVTTELDRRSKKSGPWAWFCDSGPRSIFRKHPTFPNELSQYRLRSGRWSRGQIIPNPIDNSSTRSAYTRTK